MPVAPEPAYAGIGSRKAPPHVLEEFRRLGRLLAARGWILSTGACSGPDQAFATGAVAGRGSVRLFLPWAGYEAKWIKSILEGIYTFENEVSDRAYVIAAWDCTKLPRRRVKSARESVETFHPASGPLKTGARLLHARNWHICFPNPEPFETKSVSFILCWTPGGRVTGGTGQALRIAAAHGIEVINFGSPKSHKQQVAALLARAARPYRRRRVR